MEETFPIVISKAGQHERNIKERPTNNQSVIKVLTFFRKKSFETVGELNPVAVNEETAADEVVVKGNTDIFGVPNDMDDFAAVFHVFLWQPSEW